MKIAAFARVEDQFSAYVQESQASPVIITKNGKPVALLTGIRDEDDLDSFFYWPTTRASYKSLKKPVNASSRPAE